MRKDRGLSAEERMQAREALGILEGSGISLVEAARRCMSGAGRAVRTRLDDGIDLFLRDCLRRNLRESTFGFYEDKLRTFERSFENRDLDSFTRAEIRQWLDGLNVGPETREGYRRAIRVFWRWARKQEPPLCALDVTEGLALPTPKRERSIGILTPDEAAAVMEAAGPYTATLALMLFAGVRPSEIKARGKPAMVWRQIDFDASTVRIEAGQSKTRQARVMDGLPDNLWAWLKAAKAEGEICPGFPRQAVRIARDAIGRAWPQDACRHSFATYHVALAGNVERTALILGHEGALGMLHRHYRGVATKAEAVAFFGVRP
jgi:site-specific recombinase XerD